MLLRSSLIGLWLAVAAGAAAGPALEDGFRNPPMTARPATYYIWLNGYMNHSHMEKELEEFKAKGIGGLLMIEMGARGTKETVPPPGPAFLSDESLRIIGRAIRTATRLGMEVDLGASSSWDMGGSWVTLEDSSKALDHTTTEIAGPRRFSAALPFPPVPDNVPKGSDGGPAWYREVALLAIPNATRLPGHEFVIELDPPGIHTIQQLVLFNTAAADAAREFSVGVSTTGTEPADFREVQRGSLARSTEGQEYHFRPTPARYVRLRILSSHDAGSERVQLAEFEVYGNSPLNLAAGHEADRARTGAQIVRYTSALGQGRTWSAANLTDGVRGGPDGTWSSAAPPPMIIQDPDAVLDLSGRLKNGRLEWDVPAGNWTVLRFVCLPTGERLKIPSPSSNGYATDHLSAEISRRYADYVTARLRKELGDFSKTALKNVYLPSYEVTGRIWTPEMASLFAGYRGYPLLRYLPALAGHIVKDQATTARFVYDYRKTLGDLIVDGYYGAVRESAHKAGLKLKSESGGPGPPIHQVPVDALKALGAVDSPQGEFWPRRPTADAMWVVKETACGAHIYGHRRVHMESFTSSGHFQDSPQDLKPSADRVFCEGANHIVWHTSSHVPPEAGKPGWLYGAGNHLSRNEPWWPMAGAFLDYLGRASFLLQQGLFVADVLYYYGDQGFNFVPPKKVDPSLGYGFDYDVTNAEVILKRLDVRSGRLVLPDGMSYHLLSLPEREDMDLDVLRRLEALISKGATVVGPKPVRSVGLTGWPERDEQVRRLADKIWGPCDGKRVRENRYGEGRVIWGRRLREILAERNVGPDFAFTSKREGTRLDFVHRRDGDADIYFVRNMLPQAETVQATFRVTGKRAELWLPDSGEIRPQRIAAATSAGTTVPLRLDPNGALFVVFRPGSGSRLLVEEEQLPGERTVAGPWKLSFPPDWGAPDSVTLPELISWTDHSDDGVRYFSGLARYEKDIEIPEDWLSAGRRVYIDLGQLWAAAEVSLNGKPAGIAWKEPFRVELTGAAKPGTNRLTVAVANTWSNRLAGDARSTSGKRYTRTNITNSEGVPWAKAPLLKSGLFGPVRLIAVRTKQVRLP